MVYRRINGKRYAAIGEHVTKVMPYSEVMMHMRLAGKEMTCFITPGTWPIVQLLTETGSSYSAPVTLGEAGFYQDENGFYYNEDVNVWGTERNLIDSDEFCPECEREVPFHYENCPTRKAGK